MGKGRGVAWRGEAQSEMRMPWHVCAFGVPRAWGMPHMRKRTVCARRAPGFAAVAESKRFSVPNHKLHFSYKFYMATFKFSTFPRRRHAWRQRREVARRVLDRIDESTPKLVGACVCSGYEHRPIRVVLCLFEL